MAYCLEYKQVAYPYSYRYLMKGETLRGRRFYEEGIGEIQGFDSIVKARKKCISLINEYIAILGVVRGGVEQLVYETVKGNFVLEDRKNGKWYRLNKDGSLGSVINNVRDLGLIRSA